MMIEYEARVLEIDPLYMKQKILSCGGQAVRSSLMRRYVYAVNQDDLQQFIRLRDTGFETTLTYKEIKHDGIDGTDETEIVVDDFDRTDELLSRLGYQTKWYQENHRNSFLLSGARLEIDQWPMIPPYIEIEADSYEEVIRVAQMLGYRQDQLVGENTLKIYAHYGIDLKKIEDLRFTGEIIS
ncbi:CYTH domain-containing protein [Shimazuella kribbensis]|uniref:CYTH domain-containing protein n=1 Tax=Shimazuella kribbensis TaxID=139808 RepID=UPI00055B8303|nr:CYTH domain-containing protein [Shimazuella kribbensis]